ncbi:hypothetical protein [Silanimonas sp.]|uniref:hypothetical protein n=1 Tax=Silanimonas sp. TaxID=1929290 RepID=UPI0022CBC970|nr:hypothetical protein [Silanimonas sp.]MCZ8061763.1 hypothetical protein [Silanimonas sp.]
MFGIYTLFVLLILLPLSISAGNRCAKGAPLNTIQMRLFVNPDIFQKALGKHYTVGWWAWWVGVSIMAMILGYWGSVLVFAVYIWSRIRFQKIVARPPEANDASN